MATTLVTPEAVASYPHVLAPQKAQKAGDKEKFSMTFVFLPGTDLRALEAAALEAAVAKFGESMKLPNGASIKTADALAKGLLRSPFRRDVEMKGYPEGSVFINCRTETKPTIVTAAADPSTGRPRIMSDEEIKKEIYPGAIVRASVSAFGYETSGNRGVSFGLNNVQKLRDGERLDNRKPADQEFDAVLNAEPADLSALGV